MTACTNQPHTKKRPWERKARNATKISETLKIKSTNTCYFLVVEFDYLPARRTHPKETPLLLLQLQLHSLLYHLRRFHFWEQDLPLHSPRSHQITSFHQQDASAKVSTFTWRKQQRSRQNPSQDCIATLPSTSSVFPSLKTGSPYHF